MTTIIRNEPLLQGLHPELQLYAVYVGGDLDKIAEALMRFDDYETKGIFTFHRGLNCGYIEPDKYHNSIELRHELSNWLQNQDGVNYIECPLMTGGGMIWTRSMAMQKDSKR